MVWHKNKYKTGEWGSENPILKNHERIITAVHTLLGEGRHSRARLAGVKVLELGCGNGELLAKLAGKGAIANRKIVRGGSEIGHFMALRKRQ